MHKTCLCNSVHRNKITKVRCTHLHKQMSEQRVVERLRALRVCSDEDLTSSKRPKLLVTHYDEASTSDAAAAIALIEDNTSKCSPQHESTRRRDESAKEENEEKKSENRVSTIEMMTSMKHSNLNLVNCLAAATISDEKKSEKGTFLRDFYANGTFVSHCRLAEITCKRTRSNAAQLQYTS